MKRSSILRLMTEEGLKEGHNECSDYLERQVEDLLLTPHPLDQEAQDTLLAEISPVFSDKDNEMLCAPPTEKEMKQVLSNSHWLAAPGIDGIPSLLYHVCWETMKEPLMEMTKAVFSGNKPSLSQRTAMMVFGCKTKYPLSLKPAHKRRISLLCSDFKLISGIEAA